ncbi:hypothetical protein SLEP1_g15269 [Rubroshorea leprosula]|uniref:protein-serine/threonine phosphatase n=1 Tax=Rubroshorea leprosula TaxID=152421 RepID=A0AAV5IYJ1_9ROSI|nr:hypothetical protein SLEP1_g15269 [Rubroshorea leprosula]
MEGLDVLIERLLDWKNNEGKRIQLHEYEIRQLCISAKQVFLSQPILLELVASINICGDIHVQYPDLLRLFESKFPNNFFLLQGNHECASINRIYGFYDECKRRFSVRLRMIFADCFNCLPVAAVVDDKLLCMHGGLSPEMQSLDQIRAIERPKDVPHQGLLCYLLWADPDEDIKGWDENDRGVSFIFGTDKVAEFLKKHDLDLICRAHQVVEDGYELLTDRQMVTIFSAPNYCGEFNNAGAMMRLDTTLLCAFQILKPGEEKWE